MEQPRAAHVLRLVPHAKDRKRADEVVLENVPRVREQREGRLGFSQQG